MFSVRFREWRGEKKAQKTYKIKVPENLRKQKQFETFDFNFFF